MEGWDGKVARRFGNGEVVWDSGGEGRFRDGMRNGFFQKIEKYQKRKEKKNVTYQRMNRNDRESRAEIRFL